ncbi:hypothetical protein LOTGIDRAFT_175271 [Lottia gigantea]|uniref:Endonuclease/exonuclease/phosphatase domain-containing protein n=1 Tax=Lottia gigantea TaxID=225164 RepID=V4ADK9_LOTGI|nr:hypothetical protein LOTGIDRAFT_175271 [Lottia gigantea]ESO94932.1 hypothetical protein LOTGIDRAFT_175271 [Lottia gigantea]
MPILRVGQLVPCNPGLVAVAISSRTKAGEINPKDVMDAVSKVCADHVTNQQPPTKDTKPKRKISSTDVPKTHVVGQSVETPRKGDIHEWPTSSVEEHLQKFIQLNINGLNVPERKTQLVQLLQRKQYDAVFLQESKLGSRNKDPIINGYTLIRLNRPNALNHQSDGGLAIYIKNGISHGEVPLKTISPLEAQTVSFTDKSKFFLSLIFIDPKSKANLNDSMNISMFTISCPGPTILCLVISTPNTYCEARQQLTLMVDKLLSSLRPMTWLA